MAATYTQLLRELLKERRELYSELIMKYGQNESTAKFRHLENCCSDIMEDLYDDMTDEHGNLKTE